MTAPNLTTDDEQLTGYAASQAMIARARTGGTPCLVRVRLLFAPPDDPAVAGVPLGVQGRDQQLVPGAATADGRLQWEIAAFLREDGRWTGSHVHGKPGEEFIYISWKRDEPAATWVWRIKIYLTHVPPGMVDAVAAHPRGFLQADVTGRLPHDRRPVPWQAAEA